MCTAHPSVQGSSGMPGQFVAQFDVGSKMSGSMFHADSLQHSRIHLIPSLLSPLMLICVMN